MNGLEEVEDGFDIILKDITVTYIYPVAVQKWLFDFIIEKCYGECAEQYGGVIAGKAVSRERGAGLLRYVKVRILYARQVTNDAENKVDDYFISEENLLKERKYIENEGYAFVGIWHNHPTPAWDVTPIRAEINKSRDTPLILYIVIGEDLSCRRLGRVCYNIIAYQNGTWDVIQRITKKSAS